MGRRKKDQEQVKVKTPKKKAAAGEENFNPEAGDAVSDMPDDAAVGSVEDLLDEGAGRGYVTHDDIERHLPADTWDADTIDRIFTNLQEMGIDVVDKATIGKVPAPSDTREEFIPTIDSELAKLDDIPLTDPVRMYLREIGKVSLLTAAEEVDLAQRMEKGDVEAKKRLIEMGYNEVRGIYEYCLNDYVEDYEVESNFPEDQTYTLSLKATETVSVPMSLLVQDSQLSDAFPVYMVAALSSGSETVKVEKVIRSARNKVAGQCGCTPETSCYGCLRNYSNQYYHDNISRGLAYEYLDWLINRLPVTEYDTEEATVTKPEVETEQVGLKKMIYDAPDVSIYPDVVSVFASMIESSDDESEIIALKKLIDIAKSGNYENPITEEKLPAAEGDLWPDIFWGSSKVALFTESMRKQYNILRKYDWYCYILDEKINAERVFSHIKEM